ncbi:uncharacterized protein LOC101768055 isoform X1 [Setaria italica]|uniref:uncharacterized protein LOC101768055 isoform X1 n=1 Tax=Setaria italica TaxID=4555 RepID=UPI00064631AE|nr:uncharacterized protein LOC101768055 isoform X1 [Setaria italica]
MTGDGAGKRQWLGAIQAASTRAAAASGGSAQRVGLSAIEWIVSSRMFEDIGRNYGYFPDPTNLYVVKCKMCVKDARSIALQAARIRRPYDNYLLSTGSFLVSVSASHLEDVSYQSTMVLLRVQNPDTGYAHGGKGGTMDNWAYCTAVLATLHLFGHSKLL